MKFLFLFLISIITIILLNSSQEAEAKLLPNGIYLLQGNGFVISKDIIEVSKLDLQFSTNKIANDNIKLNLKDGIISISDDDYITSSGWTGTTLSDGRFVRLSGSIESSNGIKIPVTLFGRLVDDSSDGIVYSFTGRLKVQDDSLKLVYIVKIIGSPVVHIEEEDQTQEKTILINILSGSSNPGNIRYYSTDTITISPGTTITWKNEDSVSHTILSGIASFSPGKPFKPDYKINSGEIAPGQTFNATINDVGITRFFDSTYSWMDGVIVTLPKEKSTSLGKNTETALDIKNKYLNKEGN
ncbi:MAG: cupredoxin domain-containing protein [Nitrosopumilaceae archaeon]